MKIVITGLSGFVGSNLKTYLLRFNNFEIEAYTRLNTTPNISKDTQIVVHLAGKAHDLKKTSNPEEYYHVNYELTKKLYNAFLKSEASKFIFISSVKAVADNVDGVLTEEFNADPQTDYGKSKLLAEQYIQNQPLPAGKSYYILRPCMIHGPGNKGNLNLLYQFIKKGIPYPLASFHNQRSYLSVENLCFVIKEIISDHIPSGIYQIADDETFSTNQLIQFIGAVIEKKTQLWHVSPFLIKTLAKIGDILHLPLNTERLHKLTENYVVSNRKIKSVLKKPFPISAEQGIKLTISTFQH